MLVETAIDAGNMHALVEAMRTERDAWCEEAVRVRYDRQRRSLERQPSNSLVAF
ncbi:hypothetical protein MKK63_23930 [Methylobacterium sp. J-088]|uniref:hypothetical protein n=1 Tax=Methylobacterium sp. J-088 TaxID=2836664 RepID=UPI001FB9B205|nr:hypothetical protein [Methylobacterium sp. J-088]MCJ2065729.1 hypothetical protein [Methylobacterium sp. J-088]